MVNLVEDFLLHNNRIVTRTYVFFFFVLFFFKFSEHEKLRKGGSEPRSVEILKLMSTLGKSSSSIGYDPLIASNRLFSFLSTHCSFTRLFSPNFYPFTIVKARYAYAVEETVLSFPFHVTAQMNRCFNRVCSFSNIFA